MLHMLHPQVLAGLPTIMLPFQLYVIETGKKESKATFFAWPVAVPLYVSVGTYERTNFFVVYHMSENKTRAVTDAVACSIECRRLFSAWY